jgi:hypothetical protein
MKMIQKTALLAAMVASFGASLPASAQFAGQYESDWPRFFNETVRPMMAKMSPADKKKAMEMEIAIKRMEGDHAMSMMKSEVAHRATIEKMRRELEDLIYTRGAF